MGFDTAAIRRFLFERFDDEELRQLCFDYFTDVYHDFTTGMRKSQMVQLLLEYCLEQGRLPALMAALERERPELYARAFAPPEPGAIKSPPAKTSKRDPRQLFISYAHQDSGFAHRLAGDLQQNGFDVWIAPDSIQPGEKWIEAISRGLDESGIFILILTPSAVESRWVQDETHVAIELNAEGKLQFIPLLVEPCELPALWRVYQRISFHEAYQAGMNELLDLLGAEKEETPQGDIEVAKAELEGAGSWIDALPIWGRIAAAVAMVIVALLIVSQLLPASSTGADPSDVDELAAASLTQTAVATLPETTVTPTTAAPTRLPDAERLPDADEIDVWRGFMEEPYFQGEIQLGETITVERLEPGGIHTWLFRGGPASIDIILEGRANINYQLWVYDQFSTSFDERLPRGYVDFNGDGGGEQLTFLEIPEGNDHIIAVAGSVEAASDYQLTVSESMPGVINLGETVEGTLLGDNPGVWQFRGGPATIDITLSVGPDDAGLLMLFDDDGSQLESQDVAGGDGKLRLTNVTVPDDAEYGIVVRDVNNDGVSYVLSVSGESNPH